MKQGDVKYKRLGISVCFTLVCLIFSLNYFDTVSLSICLKKLGIPLFRLLVFIFIGLLAGQLIESLGWTRHVAVLARPFFRFSNLGNQCSAAFTTAFISGATANAMLLDFYEDKKISKIQLFLSNYINQFPAFFLHLPTTVFIVLPLTGYAGAIYFIITFMATLLRTICFLVFGRLYLKPHKNFQSEQMHSGGLEKQNNKTNKKEIRSILKSIRTKLPGRIINIVVWVLPIYTLVFILNINGFFDYLNQALAGVVTVNIMPVESLSVVILSFAAEFTSGFAAAGALMDAGVISVKQTVIALLLGNVLAFPIRALRHQLPRYMGIFSPKMGLQLLLSGQVFRVLSIVLMGTLYYMVA
ncbi:nucleoside recognition protein [Desulfobacula toluolica]|uniref:Nucleoside recognition domain protein (Gate) n=1 Tax=Desulfobacula toluolica (strain DSM 7467 / Tol2) TaxID=651182 RepID=K0NP77_DESTT|nr:nucleoside recognition protein [Desulfobacula toluolica]CCK82495.1 nucleoside recognition domain protein (Gate) [Desulfobacula toluolica Tol2]